MSQSGSEPTPEPGAEVPAEVYKEVLGDYFKGVFALSDAARSRSQAAWAIASAIAGALVTAGLIKDFSGAPIVVQVLGIAAVAAWLATGAVFMWVVITPLPRKPTDPEGTDPEEVKREFVERALTFFRGDLETVQRRQTLALFATVMAGTFTVGAIVASVSVDQPIHTVPATLLLTADGKTHFQSLCGSSPLSAVDTTGASSTVSGNLEVESVKESNLVLEVPSIECPKAAQHDPGQKDLDLVLDRSKDVAAIETRRITIRMF